MHDPYDELAEFHDLFMDSAWQHLAPVIRDVTGHLTETDVVVEIGGGSGVGTSVIAAQCPAEILTLEPNPTMRAMLLTRIGADPDLARRVTVLASGAPQGLSDVPDGVQLIVIAHVLGHLGPGARRATWAGLAARLAPSGVILATTQESPTPDHRPRDVVETRRIGRHIYTATHHAAADTGPCTFSTTYQVHGDGALLRERTVRGHWSPIGVAQLRQEVAFSGLVTQPLGSGLALIRGAEPRPHRTER